MTFEDVVREASTFSGWRLQATLKKMLGGSVELSLQQPGESDSLLILVWHPHTGLKEVRLRLRFWGFTPKMIEAVKSHMEEFRKAS